MGASQTGGWEGGACACSSVWVFVEEVDVLNALMNMYVKCGYVVAAGKVFDSMAVMDFISWNAAGHFFENGDCNTGLELFLTMLQDQVQPNLRKFWDGSGGNVWLLVSLAFSVLILILSLIQRWKCAFRNPYNIPISTVYFVTLFFYYEGLRTRLESAYMY